MDKNEAILWEKHKMEGDICSRDKLVIKYMYLVYGILKRMKLPSWFDEREDLRSQGFVGLIEAIDRFDPARGIKFATFAEKRIRGAMQDWIRKQDWIPKSTRTRQKQYESVIDDLRKNLNREPEAEERAEAFKLTEAEELRARDKFGYGNLHKFITLDCADDRFMTDYSQPSECLELGEMIASVNRIVGERCRPCIKDIIYLYYYESLPMREVAERVNLSESRVSQLHARTIKMLRSELTRAA